MNVPYVYRDRLVGLARQAGAMMKSMRGQMAAEIKDGQPSQVVTAADTAISRLLRRELGDNLLEEESIEALSDEDVHRLLTADEVFIADPIDGTACYARSMGTEGVTIGVYRSGVPVAGVVYCPTIASPYAELAALPPHGILVYAERVEGDYVGYSRIGGGLEVPLSNAPADLSPSNGAAFVGVACQLYGAYQPAVPLWPWHTHAFVADVVDVALGRTCGMFYSVKLWDAAGAMAIWQACGLAAINIVSGERLTRLHPGNYPGGAKNRWGILAPHLVCHPANVRALCARLHDRQGKSLRIPGVEHW